VKIGVLTGGGDAPGLNAVIRGVVRKAHTLGWTVAGFRHGWAGPMAGEAAPLDIASVSGILPRGGTIIGTSRTNPFKKPDGPAKVLDGLRAAGVEALVAIGGEDTLGVAARLHREHGLHVVGVPKTIDNDLSATDQTFGFDTAVSIATEAIDRLHTTAESHNRVMVVEVMGRHAGWIALWSGMAGGADFILIPEVPFDLGEVCDSIRKRHARGKSFSIVVVAEGAKPVGGAAIAEETKVDEFGHVRLGGIGNWIGAEIEKRTHFETRVTILGHVQRGGTPTAFDRVLASRFGIAAVEYVEEGRWGHMAALQGVRIVPVPIDEAVREQKTVPLPLYEKAKVFFG
jgi:6-phosphofructokinase 1